MKHAIFQFYFPYNGVGKKGLTNTYTNEMPAWALYSNNLFKEYAKKHNAEYVFGTDRFVKSRSNYFEICRVFLDKSFDQYDKVLTVDLDVIPHNMNANIFKENTGDLAGWPEYRHMKFFGSVNWGKSAALTRRFEHFGSKLVDPETVNNPIRMINTGVLVWSKSARLHARKKFTDHEEWFGYKNNLLDSSITSKEGGHSSHCLDQPYINAMATREHFDVVELDIKWNHFPTKDNSHTNANFIHYVGNHRYKIPNIYNIEYYND